MGLFPCRQRKQGSVVNLWMQMYDCILKAIQAIVETAKKTFGDVKSLWNLDCGRVLGEGLVPAVGWLIRGL